MAYQQYTVSGKSACLLPGRETGSFILTLGTASPVCWQAPVVSSLPVSFAFFRDVKIGDTISLDVRVSIKEPK